MAGVAVGRIVRPLSRKFGGGGTSAAALSRHWPQIVGERWAKISAPLKYTGGRDRRTLVISAPGAAASLIMAASGPIIERLNTHLGEGYVKRLRVVQTKMTVAPTTSVPKRGLSPQENKQLQEGLSKLEEGGLKRALETLGRGVMTDDT